MSQAAANLSVLLYNPDAPVIDKFSGQWAFLSNFFTSVLVYEGIEYQTAEAAFNAGKTLDPDLRRRIAAAPSPSKAKYLGRSVALRPNWDESVRYDVMADVLRAKFLCDPRRTQALLSTGASLLIEGVHWHDQHWGSCSCGRPECEAPGQNHLGRMLMALRSEIRATR